MIDFRNVSLTYGTQDVLLATTFRVNRGERIGVVGPNGAGKSTLFQLITGECEPTVGEVLIEGRPRIGHVHQHLAAREPDDTLLEYSLRASPALHALEHRIHAATDAIEHTTDPELREQWLNELGKAQTAFEDGGGYRIETIVKTALCGLGFLPDELGRPFASFSGGWQMRAELVRTLAASPDLLLLDEPTNYLDVPAVEWLQRFLREYDGTLLLISHDRYLLQSLTRVTLDVDACTVTRYEGDWAWSRREREQRIETQLATHRNVVRQREQMQRFVDRFRSQSSKASLVQSRIKAIERLPEVPLPRRLSHAGHLRIAVPPRSGVEAVRLENLGLAYEPGRWVLRGLSFSLNRGDRAAVVGFNGMGKTTLLRLLAGTLPTTEGRRVLGHNVVEGYQSQAFEETLPPAQSVLNAVRNAAPAKTEGEVRTLLGSFGFAAEDVYKPSGVLSGGERIRLAFARMYVQTPNLLLLDEPTTHLDIEGREALENALRAYPGTICVVSHDIAFVRSVATRIVHIDTDGVRLFPGGYDAFRESMTGASEQASPADASSSRKSKPESGASGGSARDRRRDRAAARAARQEHRRKLTKRVAVLESRIMALESEQAECVAKLADPDTTDYATLNRRLGQLHDALDEANREWEAAGSALTDDATEENQ